MSAVVKESLYDQDFYAWINKQVDLLRAKKFNEIDLEHLSEEIEDMGKSEKRSLRNHLVRLIQHLLKWEYQPERRGRSWELTIKAQRQAVRELLLESPSLKHKLPEIIDQAYVSAIYEACAEINTKTESDFPEKCIYTFDMLLDNDFWPQ
ncbi:MAG: DUF29 domain-containing protein [Pseudomonadota bacterium]